MTKVFPKQYANSFGHKLGRRLGTAQLGHVETIEAKTGW
jgi:hypothetical protein